MSNLRTTATRSIAMPMPCTKSQRRLKLRSGNPGPATIAWRPQNAIELDDKSGETLLKMLEALEDSDDVQSVYANFEVSDALMEKLGA